MANNLFTPSPKATVSITCGVASANINLNTSNATVIRVYNSDSTNVAYVEFGNSSAVTAGVPSGSTKGSLPIGPGEVVGVTVPVGTVFAAAICTAGTPVVYFTPGYGV